MNRVKLWVCVALAGMLLLTPLGALGESIQDRAATPAKYFEYVLEGEGAVITGYVGPDRLTKVVVPAKLDGHQVVAIGYYAFSGRGDIRSVTLPKKGLLRIEEEAFLACGSLTTINIPSSVTYIGEAAFMHCEKLKAITIPKLVKIIEPDTFGYCKSLKTLRIQGQITRIGAGAFQYCAFTKITISPKVEYIGEGAFSGCKKLRSIKVSLENQYYSSEGGVLYNKDKSSLLVFPGACNITDFKVPSTVREIGDRAFADSKHLRSVKMGDGVARIGDYAFYCCKALREGTLSKTITAIRIAAFAECISLKSIDVSEGVLQICNFGLDTGASGMKVYLPRSLQFCGGGSPISGDDNVFSSDSTLYVYAGSYAQQFAISKGFNYELR